MMSGGLGFCYVNVHGRDPEEGRQVCSTLLTFADMLLPEALC